MTPSWKICIEKPQDISMMHNRVLVISNFARSLSSSSRRGPERKVNRQIMQGRGSDTVDFFY